jgi:hypothetical protein
VEEKVIDASLLKSDWSNSEIYYWLFFEDSTVFSFLNFKRNHVHPFTLKHDTLTIHKYPGNRNIEVFKILNLTEEILVLKVVQPGDYLHLRNSDTISLINIASINPKSYNYKRIEFIEYQRNGSITKEVIIDNDSLTVVKYLDDINHPQIFKGYFDERHKTRLNNKIKLINPDNPPNLDIYYTSEFTRIKVRMLIENYEEFSMYGNFPHFDENFMASCFFIYIRSLDKIIPVKRLK